jgi:sulfoxide reductase catalytic subunit YedY
MLIKNPDDIKSSEITDKELYLNRGVYRGALWREARSLQGLSIVTSAVTGKRFHQVKRSPCANAGCSPPINENLTSYKDITNYNNFYEFSTDKLEVAKEGEGIRDSSVDCGG